MIGTVSPAGIHELPPAPKNPLPFRQQLNAIRAFHTGLEILRDAGGPVTRLKLAPSWLVPPVVVVTSPQGARDVLRRGGGYIDKTPLHPEQAPLLRADLFHPTNKPLLPRPRTPPPL